MKNKILIIGNGAKEYALAKKMSEKCDIYVAPAADAMKEFATCVDIREDDISALLEFVLENGIDMTVPISQKALECNIADVFNENKQPVFGSSNKSNEIVFQKTTAKKVLYKLHIPTPKFGIFDKSNNAVDYIKNQKIPFVIKTNDANSAVVLTSQQEAKNIIDYSFIDKNNRIIIEDYIYGTSFSFYTITDGYKALPIGSSVTYKHSLEGDGGQLTSGMAACVPNYKLSIDHEYYLMDNVIYPTLEYLENTGKAYLGILGVNGIINDDGQIQILGWQSFMNDCDSASVLENINDDLFDLFYSCIIGSFSDEVEKVNLNDQYSVSLVLQCKNKNNSGNVISGLDDLSEDTITTFYPSVKRNRYLELEADSGSVMVLTDTAYTASKAADKVYEEAGNIKFSGVSYRKDICRV